MSMHDYRLEIDGSPLNFFCGFDCQAEIIERLLGYCPDRLVVVTDDSVANLYTNDFVACLAKCVPTLILSNPPGEKSKTLACLVEIAEKAIAWGVTRRSIVVTFGGGVPGNIGGMLAAILFRGVRLVHIPITLIAISDSVVSLKQAVNSNLGKNLLGCYYRPTAILCDVNYLNTLPTREWRSGLCELVKNALAIDPETIPLLENLLSSDICIYQDKLVELIKIGVKTKCRIMADDPYERHAALALEYGHTIGHAIEAVSSKSKEQIISHGEAVGIGMIVAAFVSRELGYLEHSKVEAHLRLLHLIGVDISLPVGITETDVINIVRFDNKRGYCDVRQNEIPMVLLADLGIPAGSMETPLVPVPIHVLRKILRLTLFASLDSHA